MMSTVQLQALKEDDRMYHLLEHVGQTKCMYQAK